MPVDYQVSQSLVVHAEIPHKRTPATFNVRATTLVSITLGFFALRKELSASGATKPDFAANLSKVQPLDKQTHGVVTTNTKKNTFVGEQE